MYRKNTPADGLIMTQFKMLVILVQKYFVPEMVGDGFPPREASSGPWTAPNYGLNVVGHEVVGGSGGVM